jgi:beta-glucanase (GH16 family)
MKYLLNLVIFSILLVSLSGSCKKESSRATTPDISFNGALFQVAEDDPDASIIISVVLSERCNKQVSIGYSTYDSTAIAGKDYMSVTQGNLVFQPGETSKEINIAILPDTTVKKDVYFNLALNNPVNGNLARSRTTIKIINVDYANLLWSDEFNTGLLDITTWNYEVGATGWGNHELENYTSSIDNVHIDSGYLHISALNPSGKIYTSGRITTQGKKEFTYGRVDIRAVLPEGQGIWPALWMLGSNFSSVGWPGCGETDIMELIGNYPSVIHGSVHWSANGLMNRTSDYTLTGGKFSSGFHVFSFIWTPNNLKWLIDDWQYFHLTRSEINGFPFDLPMFFIFDVAVGGDWPGSPDTTTVFPQNMIVDYIRVYQ